MAKPASLNLGPDLPPARRLSPEAVQEIAEAVADLVIQRLQETNLGRKAGQTAEKTADVGETLLTRHGVARVLGVCERTVRRMVALGEFPEHDCMVSASPRWNPATVQTWVKKGGKA